MEKDYLSKPIDINEIYLKMCGMLSKDIINKIPSKYKNYKNSSGNSLGHYRVIMSSIFCNVNNIEQKDLNQINNFSESPELYSVLTGNSKLLREIISNPHSNFERKTEGGLSPLNIALVNDSREIVNILLETKNIRKNGDLNSRNELGYTPLHLAIMFNNDKAVKTLLENGADISLQTRKQDNSSIHLMGIYSRNEIISNILKDKGSIAHKKLIHNINNNRLDKRTALHFMSTNSILGTKLLYNPGADYEAIDMYGNTPIKYALYSGRFDIYDFFNEKKFKQDGLNLKGKIDSLKMKSTSGNSKKNKEDEDFTEDEEVNYKLLIKLFEKNNIKDAKILIKNNMENILLNEEQIYDLIEISCRNRNLELLKLLNDLTQLKGFHIGPYLGKYGLQSWFKEVSNFGIDITSKSENVLNNKDIYDFCIMNEDLELLEEIFQFDYKTSDELIIDKISYIFSESLVNKKDDLIIELMNELKNKKYEDFQISLETLIKNINTTLSILKSAIINYPKVNCQSINLEIIME